MKPLRMFLLTILFVVLTACAATTAAPPQTGGNGDVVAPTGEAFGPYPTEVIRGNGAAAGSVRNEAQLQNLEYTVASLEGLKVMLSNGLYEDAEEHIFVSYIGTRGYGDLDGNGHEEALVLIGSNMGGSGIFTDLALVSNVEGLVTNIATISLGDRVDIKDITIEGENILVTMVTQGPNEPMCCGTLNVTVTYALQDGALVEVTRSENGYTQGAENFYFPETFNNMTIRTTAVHSGTITLAEGRYENEAEDISAELDSQWAQYGDLNGDGKDEAVLLLRTTTPEGEFTELVVAGAQDGQVTNVATVLMGKDIRVYLVMVNDEKDVIVDMLLDGTRRVKAVYSLEGDMLEETSVTDIETVPAAGSSGLTPESVEIDFAPFAESMEGNVVPFEPTIEGPGVIGMPEHLAFGFNGEEVGSFAPAFTQLRVIPVEAYTAMFDAQDKPDIAEYFAALEAQLDGQSTELPADMSHPLPFIPALMGGQDLAANVQYVDFDGGNGYRFIFHYAHAVDAFLSGQVFYGYQGLTEDGKYLVLFMTPLHTDLLPETYDEIPQEVLDGIWQGTGYEEYRHATAETLDKATADQFAPNLDVLDGMMETLKVAVE